MRRPLRTATPTCRAPSHARHPPKVCPTSPPHRCCTPWSGSTSSLCGSSPRSRWVPGGHGAGVSMLGGAPLSHISPQMSHLFNVAHTLRMLVQKERSLDILKVSREQTLRAPRPSLRLTPCPAGQSDGIDVLRGEHTHQQLLCGCHVPAGWLCGVILRGHLLSAEGRVASRLCADHVLLRRRPGAAAPPAWSCGGERGGCFLPRGNAMLLSGYVWGFHSWPTVCPAGRHTLPQARD